MCNAGQRCTRQESRTEIDMDGDHRMVYDELQKIREFVNEFENGGFRGVT